MWRQWRQKENYQCSVGDDRPGWCLNRANRLSCRVSVHPRGTDSLVLQPGDVVFIQCRDIVGLLVRAGQRLRRSYRRGGYAQFDHVALAVGPGTIVEADRKGVHATEIAQYRDTLYLVVSYDDAPVHRDAAVAFANFREDLGAEGLIRYGFVTVFFLAFRVWLRSPFVIVVRNTDTCAQLVAESLAHAGVIFERDPADMVPADLARELRVAPDRYLAALAVAV